MIGPYTPGFVGDVGLAQQAAAVGVILLMFGVGLHFNLKELWAVRSVAILHGLGWSLRPGLVLGMAMSVASTVVLLRVLIDRNMLSSIHGLSPRAG